MRQLRGYLAHCGLGQQLDQLARERDSEHCALQLRKLVTPDMWPNHQIVLFRNGELVILVDQPHWAAWLRARQKRLLSDLQEANCRVKSLRIATTPSLLKVGKRAVNPLQQAPAGAGDTVSQAAGGISNPDLKHAMQRLGKRLNNKR